MERCVSCGRKREKLSNVAGRKLGRVVAEATTNERESRGKIDWPQRVRGRKRETRVHESRRVGGGGGKGQKKTGEGRRVEGESWKNITCWTVRERERRGAGANRTSDSVNDSEKEKKREAAKRDSLVSSRRGELEERVLAEEKRKRRSGYA